MSSEALLVLSFSGQRDTLVPLWSSSFFPLEQTEFVLTFVEKKVVLQIVHQNTWYTLYLYWSCL